MLFLKSAALSPDKFLLQQLIFLILLHLVIVYAERAYILTHFRNYFANKIKIYLLAKLCAMFFLLIIWLFGFCVVFILSFNEKCTVVDGFSSV